MPSAPATVSIKEAAEALDVHPNTIRNYLAKHYLGYVERPSGHRRVLKADLERLRREMFSGPAVTVPDFDERSRWREDPEGTATVSFHE
jgi:DeoR/GlpR family transcriptional regulator of sugar metabolism